MVVRKPGRPSFEAFLVPTHRLPRLHLPDVQQLRGQLGCRLPCAGAQHLAVCSKQPWSQDFHLEEMLMRVTIYMSQRKSVIL